MSARMRVMQFAIDLKAEYQRDRISDVAGSLVFFGVLALFPFLIFAVGVLGVVMDPYRARSLVASAGRVAPPDVQRILGERIDALAGGGNGALLSIGMVGAFWAASSGLLALTRALNIAYGVEETRPFWKVRLIGVAMTLVAGLVSLLAVAAAFFGPALAHAIGGPMGTAIQYARLPAAGLSMMFLWALLYWALPAVKHRFRVFTPGSLAGVVVWLVASWGFSLYVRNFGKYDAIYGSLGGVMVLLVWMWISAQVLLMGAEINSLILRSSRARRPATPPADPGPEGAAAADPRRVQRRVKGLAGIAAGLLGAWYLRRHMS